MSEASRTRNFAICRGLSQKLCNKVSNGVTSSSIWFIKIYYSVLLSREDFRAIWDQWRHVKRIDPKDLSTLVSALSSRHTVDSKSCSPDMVLSALTSRMLVWVSRQASLHCSLWYRVGSTVYTVHLGVNKWRRASESDRQTDRVLHVRHDIIMSGSPL